MNRIQWPVVTYHGFRTDLDSHCACTGLVYGLIPDTRLSLPHWERPYTGPDIPLSYKAQTEEPYFPEQVYLPPPTALIISCTSSFKYFSLKLAEMTEMAVMAKGVGKSDTGRI